MKMKLLLVSCMLALLIGLAGFTGCGLVSNVNSVANTQNIAQVCLDIKTAEDGIILLKANNQLPDSVLAAAKQIIPLTQPTCNAVPQPTHIPVDQYTALLGYATGLKAAAKSPAKPPAPK